MTIKKVRYEATSEFGVIKFKKYKNLIKFILPYWPKWLHKINVYKIVNGVTYSGKFIDDNRWPIKF